MWSPHQQLTKMLWDNRTRFELFVSQAVVDEASRGDGDPWSARRLALLEDISLLALGSDAHEFANRLLAAGVAPAKAAFDALHISVAALNRMEYLLTWNCAHVANAAVRGKINETCQRAGRSALARESEERLRRQSAPGGAVCSLGPGVATSAQAALDLHDVASIFWVTGSHYRPRLRRLSITPR